MQFLCPACHVPLPEASTTTGTVVSCARCAVEVDLAALGTAAGRPRMAPELDRSGQIVGGLRMEARLGAGGMGVVYRAVPQGGGPSVAVKFLSTALVLDPDLLERFAREVEVARALLHPGIVRVLADGAADGVPWFAMELAEGGDLRRRLAQGPLPAAELTALFGPLLDALEFAHRAGVVHRDLKPANVLLDAGGAPHLADFGVARLLVEGPAATRLTETAAVLGTVAYMSPEQRAGGKVDARSDLFSVGVMLYEAATGRVPMGAFRPASSLARGYTRAFDRVLERLLAPEPEQRFPSAAAASRALLAATRKRRGRLAALGAGVAVTAAALLAGVLSATSGQAPPEGTSGRAEGVDEYQQPERVKVKPAGPAGPATTASIEDGNGALAASGGASPSNAARARGGTPARRRGWVFLGTHDSSRQTWAKSYFNVGGARPESFEPGVTVLEAQGRSNVRTGMPDPDGGFFPIIDVVREKTPVTVDEVARWRGTSYVWARVRYEVAASP